MVKFDYLNSKDFYVVGNTGSRIDSGSHCEQHGEAGIFIALFAYLYSQPDEQQRVDTVMPRCVLAQLLGSVQAHILHHEGQAAAQSFLDQVGAHAADSLTGLQQMHTQARDCCEAGFRTHGREHTCSRNQH